MKGFQSVAKVTAYLRTTKFCMVVELNVLYILCSDVEALLAIALALAAKNLSILQKNDDTVLRQMELVLQFSELRRGKRLV